MKLALVVGLIVGIAVAVLLVAVLRGQTDTTTTIDKTVTVKQESSGSGGAYDEVFGSP